MATLAPTAFLQQVRQEMAKVVWPTRDEAVKLTVVVIAVSVGIGLFIGALDIVFIKLNQLLIG
ncbi:preprotein translocase subunit SecE [Candidatus Microgenomates bacterium]|nr:MAG: preprotein translocase subunit SecE [Candidatus Microgenomates bacterium]